MFDGGIKMLSLAKNYTIFIDSTHSKHKKSYYELIISSLHCIFLIKQSNDLNITFSKSVTEIYHAISEPQYHFCTECTPYPK